jgi:hypothetical protein
MGLCLSGISGVTAHNFGAACARSRSGCVIFQEPRMALPASRRLAVEIALHQRTNFCFGLRQRYDVGAGIQLPVCVSANYLVLPEREALGVGLIHRGNRD